MKILNGCKQRVLQEKRLFLTTASWPGNRFTRVRSPNVKLSTLWQLRSVIYGAAQNYVGSETSTQPRITNQTTKQLKKIGYCTRAMIEFWNVRTLLEKGAKSLFEFFLICSRFCVCFRGYEI